MPQSRSGRSLQPTSSFAELFVPNVRPPDVKYMARLEDAIESWSEVGKNAKSTVANEAEI